MNQSFERFEKAFKEASDVFDNLGLCGEDNNEGFIVLLITGSHKMSYIPGGTERDKSEAVVKRPSKRQYSGALKRTMSSSAHDHSFFTGSGGDDEEMEVEKSSVAAGAAVRSAKFDTGIS